MGFGRGSRREGNAFFTVKYIFIVFNVLVWDSGPASLYLQKINQKRVDYLRDNVNNNNNKVIACEDCQPKSPNLFKWKPYTDIIRSLHWRGLIQNTDCLCQARLQNRGISTRLLQNCKPFQRRTLSWSRWHSIRTLHRSVTAGSNLPRAECVAGNQEKGDVPEWTKALKLKDPHLDMDFLLNPKNLEKIKENITNRKGVGDMNSLSNSDLWSKWHNATNETEKEALRKQCLETLRDVPNTTYPDVPIGEEDCARQVDLVGAPREFDFQCKSVVELGEKLGMLRTENTFATTGLRTYYLIDKLAQLEQALIRFTTDRLKDKGFELVSVPDLIHPDIIEACGFKTTGDVTQVYRLDPSHHGDVCLAGTSEMPLAGFFVDEILERRDLPVKVAAVSRCYRAETSNLELESGIYRVHQFTKVEMFGVVDSDTDSSGNEFLLVLVDIQKSLFSELGLHFRVLDMPTAELGAPANRKFDMEAWMPAKQFWGEISSASNCTDYQSRRLHIRYKDSAGTLKFCNTVNGTACAVPRTIMAICEHFQEKDGSIKIPEVLQEYMDGKTVIKMSDKVPKMNWIKSNKLKK